MPRALSSLAFVRLLLTLPRGAEAQPPQTLKHESLEQLMQIDVTLAPRTPEPVASLPTASSIVTGDDIRRSGVTTPTGAVALADGVHVDGPHGFQPAVHRRVRERARSRARGRRSD